MILLCNIPQTFLITLRSGDLAGHWITWTSCSPNQVYTIRAVGIGALSCWNINGFLASRNNPEDCDPECLLESTFHRSTLTNLPTLSRFIWKDNSGPVIFCVLLCNSDTPPGSSRSVVRNNGWITFGDSTVQRDSLWILPAVDWETILPILAKQYISASCLLGVWSSFGVQIWYNNMNRLAVTYACRMLTIVRLCTDIGSLPRPSLISTDIILLISVICTNQTWGQFHFVNSNSTQFHLVNSNSTSHLSIQFQFQIYQFQFRFFRVFFA